MSLRSNKIKTAIAVCIFSLISYRLLYRDYSGSIGSEEDAILIAKEYLSKDIMKRCGIYPSDIELISTNEVYNEDGRFYSFFFNIQVKGKEFPYAVDVDKSWVWNPSWAVHLGGFIGCKDSIRE